MAYPYNFGGFASPQYQNPYMVNQPYQQAVNVPQIQAQGLTGAYMQQPVQQQAQQQQGATNKIYVRNVDDAMNRQSAPNSEMVYIHQDLPMIIEVKTDGQGRKTSAAYDITLHKEEAAEPVTQPQEVDYVTRDEYNKLFAQLRDIQRVVQDIAKRGEIIDE